MISFAIMGFFASGIYGWHSYVVRRLANQHLAYANAAEESQDFAEAATAIETYLRLVPDDADARARLARTYDRLAKTPKEKYLAVVSYFHALGLAPNQVDLMQRLATLLVDLGGYPPAEQQARRLLGLNDRDAVGRRVFAACVYERWQSEGHAATGAPAVIDAFHKALDANPGDITLSLQLAQIYRNELKDAREAVRRRLADGIVDRAVEIHSREATAWLARHEYRRQYGLPGAEDDLKQALELAPDDCEVLFVAGVWCDRQERYAQARDHYQRAIQLAPTDRRLYEALGNSYRAQGDLAHAVDAWRDGLLHTGPGDLNLNANLADALISLRRTDDARQAIDRLTRAVQAMSATGSPPTLTRARGMLATLRAKLALSEGKLAQTLDDLRAAVAAHQIGAESQGDVSEHYQARMRLGYVYLQLGQWDLAASEFEEALHAMPGQPDARLALANAWRRSGRLDLAIKGLRNAAEASADSDSIQLAILECQIEQQLRLPNEERTWEPVSEVLERVKKTVPNSNRLQVLETVVEQVQASPGRRVARLEEAFQQNPRSQTVARSLMIAHHRQGETKAAEEVVDRHEREIDEPAPLLRGELLWLRNQYDEAKAVLRQGIMSAEGDQRFVMLQRLVNIGLTNDELRDVRAGLAVKIRQSQRPELRLVDRLADFALDARDYSELRSWEEQLRNIEGARGSLWRYYRARRLAATAKNARDADFLEAVQLQVELEGMRPQWPFTHVLHGYLAERQGRIDQAADAFRQAIALGSDRVSVYEQLIAALYRQNRFLDAEQVLKRLRTHVAMSQDLSAVALSMAAKQGETSRTLALAEEGTKKRPNDPMAHVWLGMAQSVAGRLGEAEVSLHRAVTLAPKDARTWSALAAFHVQNGRPTAAREAVEDMAKKLDLPEPGRAFVLAQAYELIADQPQAAWWYHEASRLAPRDVAVLLRAADFFAKTDPANSERCCRLALEVTPEDITARHKLAFLLLTRGGQKNVTEAWKLLDQPSALSASPSSTRRLKALLLLRQGGHDSRKKAMELLESLVDDPDAQSSDDRIVLASLLEREGRDRAAHDHLASLARRKSPKPSHLAAYVDYLLRHDLPQDAALWLPRLQEIEPDSVRTILLHARLLKRQKRSAEIERYVEAYVAGRLPSIDGKTSQATFLKRIADLYAEAGIESAAERYYRKASDLSPEAYKPMAMFLTRQGRRSEAIEWCQKAAKGEPAAALSALCAALSDAQESDYQPSTIDKMLADAVTKYPKDERLLFHLATLRCIQGRSAEAERLYRQLLSINPEHISALNNLAVLLANQDASHGESQGLIERACGLVGMIPELQDTQALLWIRQNRLQDAASLLTDVATAPTPDPRWHFHLALAQLRLGNLDEAANALNRARSSGLRPQTLVPQEQSDLNELQQRLKKQASTLSPLSDRAA